MERREVDMNEILMWLKSAHLSYAVVTVCVVQIVKRLIFPDDPDIVFGNDKWSVPKRWRKYILLVAFLVAVGLSMIFDPDVGQTLLGKTGDGLQTGAAAIAMWEVYDKWIKPVVFKTVP